MHGKKRSMPIRRCSEKGTSARSALRVSRMQTLLRDFTMPSSWSICVNRMKLWQSSIQNMQKTKSLMEKKGEDRCLLHQGILVNFHLNMHLIATRSRCISLGNTVGLWLFMTHTHWKRINLWIACLVVPIHRC